VCALCLCLLFTFFVFVFVSFVFSSSAEKKEKKRFRLVRFRIKLRCKLTLQMLNDDGPKRFFVPFNRFQQPFLTLHTRKKPYPSFKYMWFLQGAETKSVFFAVFPHQKPFWYFFCLRFVHSSLYVFLFLCLFLLKRELILGN